MAKKYVKAYYDWKQQITALSDAEKGRLFIAILEYGETGEIPMLSGREAIIFPAFQAQIDRDNQVYQSKVENGRAGGLAKASELYRKLAKSSESYQEEDKEKDKEKDKDKDKDKEEEKKEKEIPDGISNKKAAAGPPRAPASFERFWTAYPKKVGKEAARKAYSRAKVPVETLLHTLEAQKGSTQWQVENGRFIPNPATWLNQGRWEDEVCDPRKPAVYTGGQSDDESIRRVKRHMEEKRKLKTGDKDGA